MRPDAILQDWQVQAMLRALREGRTVRFGMRYKMVGTGDGFFDLREAGAETLYYDISAYGLAMASSEAESRARVANHDTSHVVLSATSNSWLGRAETIVPGTVPRRLAVLVRRILRAVARMNATNASPGRDDAPLPTRIP